MKNKSRFIKQNDIQRALTSIVRIHTPVASILAILKRGQEKRSDYRRLHLNANWKELAESCVRDIQSVNTDTRVLTRFMHERHTTRVNAGWAIKDLTKFINEAKAAKKNIRLKNKGGKRLDPVALGKSLAKRHSATFTSATAQELVRHRRDAMLHLIQADINQGALAAANFDRTATIVSQFWDNPQVNGFYDKVRQFEKGLNKHYAQIYSCIINDRPSLKRNLYNLIDWVALNIRDLVTVQLTISLLFEHPNPKDTTNLSALSSLSSRVGLLIRKLVASYLASLVSILTISGITLNPEVAEVMSKAAYRMPLLGHGIRVGKHTTIRRLLRIKKRMLVNLEGKISEVKFIDRKKRSYSIATISDFVSKHSIKIVAPINLLVYGLRDGCCAKVCGFVKRGGSAQYRQTHLEIVKLKINELYSQDIWVEAFRNLSAPYFNYWPQNYHIGFQITQAKAAEFGSHQDPSTLVVCDREQNAYNAAVKAESNANYQLISAWIALIAASLAEPGSVDELQVSKNFTDATNNETQASADLAQKTKNLQDCLDNNYGNDGFHYWASVGEGPTYEFFGEGLGDSGDSSDSGDYGGGGGVVVGGGVGVVIVGGGGIADGGNGGYGGYAGNGGSPGGGSPGYGG